MSLTLNKGPHRFQQKQGQVNNSALSKNTSAKQKLVIRLDFSLKDPKEYLNKLLASNQLEEQTTTMKESAEATANQENVLGIKEQKEQLPCDEIGNDRKIANCISFDERDIKEANCLWFNYLESLFKDNEDVCQVQFTRSNEKNRPLPRFDCTLDEKILSWHHDHEQIKSLNKLQANKGRSNRKRKQNKISAHKHDPDGDYSDKVMQETLNHQERISVIYLVIVHAWSLRNTSRVLKIPFSTVRQTIQEFLNSGRTNKLLTRSTKAKLLEDRQQYRLIVKVRRQAIGKRRAKEMAKSRQWQRQLEQGQGKRARLNVTDVSDHTCSKTNDIWVEISPRKFQKVDDEHQIESAQSDIGMQGRLYLHSFNTKNNESGGSVKDYNLYQTSVNHQVCPLQLLSDGINYNLFATKPKPTMKDECNFQTVDEKVEKVDYNFFISDQKQLQGHGQQSINQSIPNSADIPDQSKTRNLNTLQMQEQDAFHLLEHVFKDDGEDIQLPLPKKYQNYEC